jgi:hypothetical protein
MCFNLNSINHGNRNAKILSNKVKCKCIYLVVTVKRIGMSKHSTHSTHTHTLSHFVSLVLPLSLCLTRSPSLCDLPL